MELLLRLQLCSFPVFHCRNGTLASLPRSHQQKSAYERYAANAIYPPICPSIFLSIHIYPPISICPYLCISACIYPSIYLSILPQTLSIHVQCVHTLHNNSLLTHLLTDYVHIQAKVIFTRDVAPGISLDA